MLCVLNNDIILIQDLNRSHNDIDTVIVDRDFLEFINTSWVRRCKFPWCSDIVVDRTFWESLAGLDNNRYGWLRDEVKRFVNHIQHIQLPLFIYLL